jgi:hypothetical protein
VKKRISSSALTVTFAHRSDRKPCIEHNAAPNRASPSTMSEIAARVAVVLQPVLSSAVAKLIMADAADPVAFMISALQAHQRGDGVAQAGADADGQAAIRAAVTAAATGGHSAEDQASLASQGQWHLEGWVNGIEGAVEESKLVSICVAEAIRAPMAAKLGDAARHPSSELAFIRALGLSPDPRAAFRNLLTEGVRALARRQPHTPTTVAPSSLYSSVCVIVDRFLRTTPKTTSPSPHSNEPPSRCFLLLGVSL